jgi:hypothetical protein
MTNLHPATPSSHVVSPGLTLEPGDFAQGVFENIARHHSKGRQSVTGTLAFQERPRPHFFNVRFNPGQLLSA